MFDLGGIVEGRVHITVAVGVRDPLHGSGRGFSEGDRGVYSLY